MKINPLTGLIGTWKGDKGTDLARNPVEDENNPYHETLVFEAVEMEITNAEEQELKAVRYHQTVHEKETDEMSHAETGYWIWDHESDDIMCTFSIPRGLGIVTIGSVEKTDNGEFVFRVSTHPDHPEEGIAESPLMKGKAKTWAFQRELRLAGQTLSYEQ